MRGGYLTPRCRQTRCKKWTRHLSRDFFWSDRVASNAHMCKDPGQSIISDAARKRGPLQIKSDSGEFIWPVDACSRVHRHTGPDLSGRRSSTSLYWPPCPMPPNNISICT